MAKRREFSVFSLSFLDVMSCGFGAVILIFIVIQHNTENTDPGEQVELLTEVKKLEQEIENGSKKMGRLQNDISETDDEIIATTESIKQLMAEIRSLDTVLANMQDDGASSKQSVEALMSELKELEEETASLRASVAAQEKDGGSARAFLGDGQRQYLTGLNLGGEHILILVDASASMLDETIVNIIRRRNMSDDKKRASEKWQRAIKTVEWILVNLPPDASVQLVTFNDKTNLLTHDVPSGWVPSKSNEDLDKAVDRLKALIPSGPTSLHHPFALLRQLNPRPDSIFLLVDGLPTMGFERPSNSLVTSRQRVKLFTEAISEFPNAVIPVNIILFPMEGDPIAAPSFWRLAQFTGGTLLSPSRDWP